MPMPCRPVLCSPRTHRCPAQRGIGTLSSGVQRFFGGLAVCPDSVKFFVEDGADGGNLRRTDFRGDGLALKLRIGRLQGVEVGLQQFA